MENLNKEEREKIREQEKLNFINKEKSKKLRKKIIFPVLTLIIISSLIYIGYYNSKQPGKYDDFAKCLTSKNIREYGAFWCPNCAKQKELFGKSFKYIDYVECDARGNNAQPELCREKEITGYPTWEIDGNFLQGVQSLNKLSEESGCELNS